VPVVQVVAAFARSASHRLHLQRHRCSIRPSGFHTPRTHVPPQSQAVGVGPGVGAVSGSMDARAAATAAAALGASRSVAAGSAESETSHESKSLQKLDIYHQPRALSISGYPSSPIRSARA
jgi:hypothetical protein